MIRSEGHLYLLKKCKSNNLQSPIFACLIDGICAEQEDIKLDPRRNQRKSELNDI